PALADAQARYLQTGVAARVFADFVYQTRDSWSRARRVVGKAEYLPKGPNPRFVVTSLPAAQRPARALYEQEYCARGDMENRIKEQQLMLFANRVSCATMRANQVRLCLSTVAFIVMRALREFGLGESELSVSAAVPLVSAVPAVEAVLAAAGETPAVAAALEAVPALVEAASAATVEGTSALAAEEAVLAAAGGAAAAAPALEPAPAPAPAEAGRPGDAGCGHHQVM